MLEKTALYCASRNDNAQTNVYPNNNAGTSAATASGGFDSAVRPAPTVPITVPTAPTSA
ncbi:MAG: hypothetical protein J07HB67_02867 [halophilic archaeon J07HB67]|nr:MAG: hypothetical protein J07HB67_02867 [halophilic archaeon J07HB67]